MFAFKRTAAWFLFLISCCPVNAAIFNVLDGDVAGLNNAIRSANNNGEDDTIELAANGVYTLTSVDAGLDGLPILSADGGKKLTLNGNHATIQRSTAVGTPSFRILHLGAGANVAIYDVTITNGKLDNTSNRLQGAGGGILVEGANLVLMYSVISGNSSDSGAGIFNYGSAGATNVGIANCTIANNTALSGGGVYNFGSTYTGTTTMTVASSTVAGNSASYYGGGLYEDGFNGNAPLTILSSTFAGNIGGQGGTAADVQNYSGSVTIGATILNDFNSMGGGGGFSTAGYNMTRDSGGFLNASSDQHNIDAMLSPSGLQDNGGRTPTIALLSGSPAIDKGGGSGISRRDQRGYLRAGAPDVGAFEYQGGLVGASEITLGSTDAMISAEVVYGHIYRLERTSSLTSAFESASLPDLVAGADDTETITDPDTLQLSEQMYRVICVQ